VIEQLRECRRILAVLAAFGTRRGTMTWSVLWQAAIPVALGLGLAVVVGLGLGFLMLAITGTPMGYDRGGVVTLVSGAAVSVMLVTALSYSDAMERDACRRPAR
jgi:hypothetical protein